MPDSSDQEFILEYQTTQTGLDQLSNNIHQASFLIDAQVQIKIEFQWSHLSKNELNNFLVVGTCKPKGNGYGFGGDWSWTGKMPAKKPMSQLFQSSGT